jgi:DDE superfamily endonuclease
VADAGYDGPRLSFLLADLPIAVLVRMRSDQVLRRPAPPHTPATRGRPRRHGGEFVFGDPATWGEPDVSTHTETRLYGLAHVRAWNRLHPRLTHRTAWVAHTGHLPVLEGTLIRLDVARLPSGAIPKPVWLWHSRIDQTVSEVDRLWQAFLRRFDIEHTFRLFKQTVGWTAPKLRNPEAADRWTWLVLTAYTQLRLARGLIVDLRRPWERAVRPERLSPARVRRGFRNLRPQLGCPAQAPKPSRPGPGRPAGGHNHRAAQRHDVHIVTAATPKKTKSATPRPRRTG